MCFSYCEPDDDEGVRFTPLHHAVKMNNVDAAVSLIWRGCTLYDKDSKGETVIDYCNRKGSDEMKRTLLNFHFRTNAI